MAAILVDTSALYAIANRDAAHHEQLVERLRSDVPAVIVPQSVLPEICYLIGSRRGPAGEADFVAGLVGAGWRLEPVTSGDVERAAELMRMYADAAIGFVDASLVAIAERLGIRQVWTLDRRDFSLIRPKHVEAFEIVP
ncbi:MAG: PIN domain-containing protein [Candidatus Limnocylindria bacterium]